MNDDKNNTSVNEKTYKNRWIILSVLVCLPFMSTIDTTIVNVALPYIRGDLNINIAQSSWIVSSYFLSISSLILIFGRYGDIKGRDKIFLRGLLIFTVGSLLCGISLNLIMLIVARIFQGIGASMLMANNQALIAQIFPLNERGFALGISASSVALGSIIGPALGGVIITYLPWHFIFLINIPIGIIAYLIGINTFPQTYCSSTQSLDITSAIYLFSSIILIFLSLLLTQNLGFKNPYVISIFMLGFTLLAAYIKSEKKSKSPLIDLSLFKIPSFSINLICVYLFYIVINSINIIIPFYLADILNLPPSKIAIIMLINPIIMLIFASVFGHISDKIGPKKVTIFGLIMSNLTVITICFINLSTPIYLLYIALILFGFATASFNGPNTNVIMRSVGKDKFSVAGSANALFRNLGATCGTSFSTSILYFQMNYQTKIGTDNNLAFIYGMKSIYIFLTILMIFALIISLLDKYYFMNKTDIISVNNKNSTNHKKNFKN